MTETVQSHSIRAKSSSPPQITRYGSNNVPNVHMYVHIYVNVKP